MVKFIDSEDWDKLDFPLKKSVFYKSDFLEHVRSSFSYQINYLVYKEKDEVLFAAIIFSKNKNIVTPLVFTYSSIYFSQNISQLKYLSICHDFISLLKERFNKINFRLSSDIKDIRPFIWEQFAVNVRYTDVKYLGNNKINVHEKILKAVRKAIKNNKWQFEVKLPTEEIIKENLKSLKRQGFSDEVINRYLNFFTKISNRYLLSFNVKSGESVIASGLSLLDEHTRKIYALLIFSKEKHHANKYMQYKRILWAQENTYNSIDFCGANERGIAMFKAFLEPQLETYYIVSYHPFKSKILNQIQKIRKKIGI